MTPVPRPAAVLAVGLVLGLVTLTTGCGAAAPGAASTARTTAAEDTTAGGPFPHQLDGETYPGTRSRTDGTVVLLDNGCHLLRSSGVSRFVIWPRGAAQDPQDGRAVLLGDGSRVRPGDAVSATAAVLPVSALPGVPDGYWGSRLGFCVPGATDVVVLDSVTVTG